MSPIHKASQAEWQCGPLRNEPPLEPELEEVGVAAAQLLMNTNRHHICQNVLQYEYTFMFALSTLFFSL
jgi:hypothetical protein